MGCCASKCMRTKKNSSSLCLDPTHPNDKYSLNNSAATVILRPSGADEEMESVATSRTSIENENALVIIQSDHTDSSKVRVIYKDVQDDLNQAENDSNASEAKTIEDKTVLEPQEQQQEEDRRDQSLEGIACDLTASQDSLEVPDEFFTSRRKPNLNKNTDSMRVESGSRAQSILQDHIIKYETNNPVSSNSVENEPNQVVDSGLRIAPCKINIIPTNSIEMDSSSLTSQDDERLCVPMTDMVCLNEDEDSSDEDSSIESSDLHSSHRDLHDIKEVDEESEEVGDDQQVEDLNESELDDVALISSHLQDDLYVELIQRLGSEQEKQELEKKLTLDRGAKLSNSIEVIAGQERNRKLENSDNE